MSIFNSMNVTASALTAQRLRMDVVSSNIANADTTHGQLVNGKWQPYRRKVVELQTIGNGFPQQFSQALNTSVNATNGGVQVTKVANDPSPFKLVYDPTNPDANQNGYVQMPNVDVTKEMVDLIDSSQSYDANVTALNASKSMLLKALQIGRG